MSQLKTARRSLIFRAWNPELKQFICDWKQILPAHYEGSKYPIEQGGVDYLCVYVPTSNGEDSYLQAYTGLKDKNGKMIFEGDVLKFTEWSWSRSKGNIQKETLVSVVWGHAGFMLKGSKFEWRFEEGEIVGNIFENPDLLNGD